MNCFKIKIELALTHIFLNKQRATTASVQAIFKYFCFYYFVYFLLGEISNNLLQFYQKHIYKFEKFI